MYLPDMASDTFFTDPTSGSRWLGGYLAQRVSAMGAYWNDGTKDHFFSPSVLDEAKSRFSGEDWFEAMSKILDIEPGGQAKNFLVACATVAPVEEPELKVVIKGSRSLIQHGLWIQEFARYCSLDRVKVEIDAFDVNEMDRVEQFENSGVPIEIRYKRQRYDGKGKGYNVLVDDAYLYSTQEISPAIDHFSLKVNSTSSQYLIDSSIRFLHLEERRKFSRFVLGSSLNGCSCPLCVTIGSISSYHVRNEASVNSWLVDAVARVGGVVCTSTPLTKELISVHEGVKEAATTGLQVTGNKHRVALSIVSQMPAIVESATNLRLLHVGFKGKPKNARAKGTKAKLKGSVVLDRDNHVRGVGFPRASTYSAAVHAQFEGKKIAFSGITPEVLGATVYQRSAPQEADYTFVGGYDSFCGSLSSFRLVSPDLGPLPGYDRSYTSLDGWVVYERSIVKESPPAPSKCAICGYPVQGYCVECSGVG